MKIKWFVLGNEDNKFCGLGGQKWLNCGLAFDMTFKMLLKEGNAAL
jgi:hypothetical protein